MLKSELFEIISNRENSGIEFKRDDIRPEQLAKEIVAFANLEGGRILLGVEDDGTITGLRQGDRQEWVLNVFRDKVHPQLIPFYEEIEIGEGKRVAIISVGKGIFKPYAVRHSNREDVYIRMGDRSEIASREQQLRLFESGGLLCFGISPRRYLRQSGIRLVVFSGSDKEYRADLDRVLDGPLVGRFRINENGERELIDGQRSPRNPMIMDVLRNYGYVDSRGMGIRKKVIPLMKKMNNTEPNFEATEDYLKTTLYEAGK